MKNILVLILSVTVLFTLNSDDYFVIYSDSKTALLYQGIDYSYLDYYTNERKSIDEKVYSVKVRKYSWGVSDTSYYRMDSVNVYHYGKKNSKESLVLPRRPVINETWYESDSSWVYTIIKDFQDFKTPIKTYKNCVLMECKQLSKRDKDKYDVYYLYYAKGIGYVGNVDVNGKVLSYLKERVTDVKDGAVIKAN